MSGLLVSVNGSSPVRCGTVWSEKQSVVCWSHK